MIAIDAGMGRMPRQSSVVIDSFPESVVRYEEGHALVCVDVLNTSTTLVTAAARGRIVYVAPSTLEARKIRSRLGAAILAGEEEGAPIPGFDMLDSPAAVDQRAGLDPLVLVSNPGSELLANAGAAGSPTYVACLRNLTATARAVALSHRKVAVVGAGYHSEFSSEDQLACARLAGLLLAAGFAAEDLRTMEIVRRWYEAEPGLLSLGNSAAALRGRGRSDDVEFALTHIDDLPLVVRFEEGRTVYTPPVGAAPPRSEAEPSALVRGQSWR